MKYKQRYKTDKKPAKKYVPKVKKEPKSKTLFVFITALFLLSVFIVYKFGSPRSVAFMVIGFGLPIITFFHPAAIMAMLFGLAGLYWVVEAFLKLFGQQNHPYRKRFDNMIANFGMKYLLPQALWFWS